MDLPWRRDNDTDIETGYGGAMVDRALSCARCAPGAAIRLRRYPEEMHPMWHRA
jgi:hypothetical protein